MEPMAEWRAGTGDWKHFNVPLDQTFEIAAGWKSALNGVQKPWLCWNVSPRWSVLQQKLVLAVGWTPIVGFDPRVGPPPVVDGAILIDFNENLRLPVLWPHVPLEFAFLFTDRLAFWHADLLVRLPVMSQLAEQFASLQDGEMSAVFDSGGLGRRLKPKMHRFWELCGCTTKSASENQFYNGTGWWRHFQLHPKCVLKEERARRNNYDYDSGVGILYWKNYYKGSVKSIDMKLVKEGHCSEIANKAYRALPNHLTPMRDLRSEIDANYSIDDVAARLGIANLLQADRNMRRA
jgi:hypothetical protein